MIECDGSGTRSNECIRRTFGSDCFGGRIVALSVRKRICQVQKSIDTDSRCLRRSLADYQITVTTLVPGYIDTPRLREIYRNDLSRCPFCMPLNRAVETMTKAIAQRKEQVVFPPKMRLFIAFLSLYPLVCYRLLCTERHYGAFPNKQQNCMDV